MRKWGWREQAIELFWVAAKVAKGDDALQALYRITRAPEHRNVAQLSLLLNLNPEEVQRLARDLYEREPRNASYASTYAFGLYARGNTKKALQVFAALKPEQLRQPEVAAYYSVVLAASGDQERAEEFLALTKSAQLLPEERTSLIRLARCSQSARVPVDLRTLLARGPI